MALTYLVLRRPRLHDWQMDGGALKPWMEPTCQRLHAAHLQALNGAVWRRGCFFTAPIHCNSGWSTDGKHHQMQHWTLNSWQQCDQCVPLPYVLYSETRREDSCGSDYLCCLHLWNSFILPKPRKFLKSHRKQHVSKKEKKKKMRKKNSVEQQQEACNRWPLLLSSQEPFFWLLPFLIAGQLNNNFDFKNGELIQQKYFL